MKYHFSYETQHYMLPHWKSGEILTKWLQKKEGNIWPNQSLWTNTLNIQSNLPLQLSSAGVFIIHFMIFLWLSFNVDLFDEWTNVSSGYKTSMRRNENLMSKSPNVAVFAWWLNEMWRKSDDTEMILTWNVQGQR